MKQRNVLLLSLMLFLSLGVFFYFNQTSISKFASSVMGDEGDPTLEFSFENIPGEDLVESALAASFRLYGGGSEIPVTFTLEDSHYTASLNDLTRDISYNITFPDIYGFQRTTTCYNVDTLEAKTFPAVLTEDENIKCDTSYTLSDNFPRLTLGFAVDGGSMTLTEAFSASGYSLLKDGVPVEGIPFEVQDGGWNQIAELTPEVGANYSFATMNDIDGYNLILHCEDNRTGHSFNTYPFTMKESDHFVCGVGYHADIPEEPDPVELPNLTIQFGVHKLNSLGETMSLSEALALSGFILTGDGTPIDLEYTPLPDDGLAFNQTTTIPAETGVEYDFLPINEIEGHDSRFICLDLDTNQPVSVPFTMEETDSFYCSLIYDKWQSAIYVKNVILDAEGNEIDSDEVFTAELTRLSDNKKYTDTMISNDKDALFTELKPNTNHRLNIVEKEDYTFLGCSSFYSRQSETPDEERNTEIVFVPVDLGDPMETTCYSQKIAEEKGEENEGDDGGVKEADDKTGEKETVLPKTGASSYIAILGVILTSLGLGIILKKKESLV